MRLKRSASAAWPFAWLCLMFATLSLAVEPAVLRSQTMDLPAQADGGSHDADANDAPATNANAADDAGTGSAATDGATSDGAPSAASGGVNSATRRMSGITPGADVAIIPISGMIYDYTLTNLERRVQKALDAGASVIVIELDTPGGYVDSSQKIASYIKSKIPVPTVAWVNPQALSGGILIASACDMIVMSPASMTGDCAPILQGRNVAPTERAKMLSPILEEFRDNADRNADYDYAMFHAMCELGIEVYRVRHKDTGEVRLVNQADYRVMVDGDAPDYTPGPRRTATTAAPSAPATPATPDPGDSSSPTRGPGRVVPQLPNIPAIPGITPGGSTPDPTAPMVVGGASIDVARNHDRGQWELIDRVHDGYQLLTVRQSKAFDIGLARASDIGTEKDLQNYLAANSVYRIDETWSEGLVDWLTRPWVRGILLVIVLVGGYIEMQAPGIGVAGVAAAIALIVLLGGPYLVGLAEVWHLLLFFAGVCLLLAEFFITPGFGVLGITGVLCMIGALVLQLMPTGSGFRPPPPQVISDMANMLLWTLIAMVTTVVAFGFIVRNLSNIPVLNTLIRLDPVRPTLQANGSTQVMQGVSGDESYGEGRLAMQAEGLAQTRLGPTGQATFGNQVVDVVTRGEWINAGDRVRVIELHGNRIVVEQA